MMLALVEAAGSDGCQLVDPTLPPDDLNRPHDRDSHGDCGDSDQSHGQGRQA
jgi:hypothetical protein